MLDVHLTGRSADRTAPLPVFRPAFARSTLPPVRVRYPRTAASLAVTERLPLPFGGDEVR